MVGTIVFIVFLIIIIILAWSSWIIVPEQYKYALEWLGKRDKMLSPGFHLTPLIRLGWFYKIAKAVYIEEWQIPLFKSGELSDSRHEVDLVEFADMSAKVDMNMVVKVSDPIKAAYSSTDPKALMLKLMEAAVSNLLSDVNATEAITLKGEISLGALAKALEPDDSSLKKDPTTNWDDDSPDLPQSKLFKNFKRWGYKILNVTLSDVLLPDEVVLARKKVALSEIDKNVAAKQQEVEKIKADTNLMMEKKKAEGKKFEAELLAHVSAFEVQELIRQNSGMDIKSALELIVSKAKWAAIKDGDAQVFLSDGSTASEGAKFGAGFHSSKKS